MKKLIIAHKSTYTIVLKIHWVSNWQIKLINFSLSNKESISLMTLAQHLTLNLQTVSVVQLLYELILNKLYFKLV